MVDLVQAFFERDLTEAEAKALEAFLKNSTEAASRFETLSEEAYAATGLPAHQWPGTPISIHPIGSLGTGLKLFLALLAAGAGIAAWMVWHQTPMESSVKTIRSSDLLTGVETLPRPVIPVKIPVSKVSQEAEGDELSVLVENEQSSLVTVRVLDSHGQEIRALYAGVLDPGKWSFQWDGLLANGQPASSGPYRIQVQNGPHILSKVVLLESK
jgi:hypothetical protein